MELPVPSGLKISLRASGVMHVLLNRPDNLNAMSQQMFAGIATALRNAVSDDRVKVIVLSGAGRMFCSGSDLSAPEDDGEKVKTDTPPQSKGNYIDELIDFPKLMIAAVNGSGYRIGVTMLPLFDLVYSVNGAVFKTPFSELGASAEGCSSYTFPRILGPALTARLLYLSEEIKAPELVPSGFLTAILPTPDFKNRVLSHADDIATRLSITSIITSKSLVRNKEECKKLRDISAKELDVLFKLQAGPDFQESIRKYQERQRIRREQRALEKSSKL